MEASKSNGSEIFGQSKVAWMVFTTGVFTILGIILPVLHSFGGIIEYGQFMGGSTIMEKMSFHWNIMDYSTAVSSGSKNLIEVALDSNIGVIWIFLQIWGVIWILSQIVAAAFLILPVIDKITIEKSRKLELTKLGFKVGLIGTGVEYLLYIFVMIFEKWELDFGTYVLLETPSVNIRLLLALSFAWLMYYLGYSSITEEFPDV